MISEADFARLEPLGAVEYLIEYRLKDLSGLGIFSGISSRKTSGKRSDTDVAAVSHDERPF